MSGLVNLVSESLCFGGKVGFYRHLSSCCNCEMRFGVFVPPQAEKKRVPVVYFLSGLTSTEENFLMKSGVQKYAAEYGLMIVAPDTSPRNTGTPGEDDDWNLGSGAGFYVDATAEPWNKHYQMYSYVVKELPQVIAENFAVEREKQGIFGHSMGGHGALICALRNPHQYKSVSAFAPIAAPVASEWGQKIFGSYLGVNQDAWREYDASELVLRNQYPGTILIDQGTKDEYLAQLLPQKFEDACQKAGQPLTLRMQEGYNHNYYFVATFIEDHIRHHAAILCD